MAGDGGIDGGLVEWRQGSEGGLTKELGRAAEPYESL